MILFKHILLSSILVNNRVIVIENGQRIFQLQLSTFENFQLQLQLQQNRVINYNFVNYNYKFPSLITTQGLAQRSKIKTEETKIALSGARAVEKEMIKILQRVSIGGTCSLIEPLDERLQYPNIFLPIFPHLEPKTRKRKADVKKIQTIFCSYKNYKFKALQSVAPLIGVIRGVCQNNTKFKI